MKISGDINLIFIVTTVVVGITAHLLASINPVARNIRWTINDIFTWNIIQNY